MSDRPCGVTHTPQNNAYKLDELIDLGDKTWRFIDTAGIRRRAHQASGSDYYAALRTERAIENAEVVIMVLDASVPITEQDLRIISLVEDSGKALVIGMNNGLS